MSSNTKPDDTPWSEEDEKILAHAYKIQMPWKSIVYKLRRSSPIVRQKATSMGLNYVEKTRVRVNWTTEELAVLTKCCEDKMRMKDIILKFEGKRADAAIRGRAAKLGFKILWEGMSRKDWSIEEESYLKNACKDGRTVKEMIKHLGRNDGSIRTKIDLMGLKPKIYGFTDEQKSEIISNYHHEGGISLAKRLGLKLALVNQWAIRNGLRRDNRMSPDKEREILEFYRQVKDGFKTIKKYKIHFFALQRLLKKYGQNQLKNRKKGMYECWVANYGKEIADQKQAILNKAASERFMGEKNPMFGKVPNKAWGQGWRGRYKGVFFRSLKELFFMILLDKFNLAWESGETVEHRIPYFDNQGKKRNYFPDFIVSNKYIFEIKPKWQHTNPLVVSKRLAAEVLCAKRGWKYFIIEPFIDRDMVMNSIDHIVFDKDFKERFLAFKPTKKYIRPVEDQIKEFFPFLQVTESPAENCPV